MYYPKYTSDSLDDQTARSSNRSATSAKRKPATRLTDTGKHNNEDHVAETRSDCKSIQIVIGRNAVYRSIGLILVLCVARAHGVCGHSTNVEAQRMYAKCGKAACAHKKCQIMRLDSNVTMSLHVLHASKSCTHSFAEYSVCNMPGNLPRVRAHALSLLHCSAIFARHRERLIQHGTECEHFHV